MHFCFRHRRFLRAAVRGSRLRPLFGFRCLFDFRIWFLIGLRVEEPRTDRLAFVIGLGSLKLLRELLLQDLTDPSQGGLGGVHEAGDVLAVHGEEDEEDEEGEEATGKHWEPKQLQM